VCHPVDAPPGFGVSLPPLFLIKTTIDACRPMDAALPAIPAKRYFTIGEVGELCGVKPHVLRYWEQEFTQLRPVKRRGNRRYYQHHEVLMIRRIRDLLYDQGFTISGARNKLQEQGRSIGLSQPPTEAPDTATGLVGLPLVPLQLAASDTPVDELRTQLLEIREILSL
jgi:DNA-binding transcriptional MerR regulator